MSTPSRALALAVLLGAFAALGFASAPLPASAAWQPDGTPLSPAPAGPGHSYDIRGLVPAGGAIAVWQFATPYSDLIGTAFTLAAERVDVLGNRPAPWTADGSPISSWINDAPSGPYNVIPLRLLGDGAGGAIQPVLEYALIADYVTALRCYHIAPGGAVAYIVPTSLPNVLDAAVDADGSGGVVMVMRGQTFAPPPMPPPPSPLYVQRMDASGTTLWPLGQLVPPGQQLGALAALADGAGGAYFAWGDLRDAGDRDLYVQRIDATGAVAAGWPAGGLLVCGAPGLQDEPHLVPDGAGGAIVVWRDERDGSSRLYAHRVLATGVLAPGIPLDGRMLPSSGTDDRLVEAASDGAGGCFVVRATMTSSLVGLSCLHRLDPTVQPSAGWPAEGNVLNTLSPGVGYVGVVADGAGGAFVSYRNGFGTVAPEGLYAQHFAGDGSLAPGWTSAGYRLSGAGQESRIVRSGSGAIVAWSDSRGPGSQVFAQRLVTDGPVPTQMSLVRASASADGVALRWFASGAAGLRATVERRDESGGCSPLAGVVADGSGFVDYEDRAVVPGARYGYQLAWSDGGSPRTSEEAWISVPVAATLAIEPPRPNPAVGVVTLTLTLPDARGARLGLFDLAGRRVLTHDLAGLGAGRHLVPLAETASLLPGVYVVRLVHAGEARLARLCVVR